MSNKQDFLFELGCEELPPKALVKLANALHDSVIKAFEGFNLEFRASECFASPRRLAIRFNQLDTAQADQKVEKLGPAVAAAFNEDGTAKPAAMGFAKSNGVDVDALSRKQTDKGERLAYVADVKGETTANLIQDILSKAVAQLPVPKAMRWGDSDCQFSRPVHWILAIQGEKVLPVSLFDVKASNQTVGHRFHAPNAITVNAAADYEKLLLDAKVITCFEARKAKIREQVENAGREAGGVAIVDEGLLEEVACLVEWPVALTGNFDQSFLSVPSEALISSMAEHQKYFHIVDENNQLLPKFITVANIESKNPTAVIEGNEKVIRPRLADAKFFYDTDNKKQLVDFTKKLNSIVFQNKLGTLADKTARVGKLAQFIAKEIGADTEKASRAALLYKCDLMTDMVYEFPDLQGIMGRYYAINNGEDVEVANAMDEVYMPRFAGDELPASQTGLVLAIAERVDTLVGIFGIGKTPTGAKDPFALRRAALGVLRLISEKNLNLDLKTLIQQSITTMSEISLEPSTEEDLLEFFRARSLAMFQDQGMNTQVIKSVQELNITLPTDFKRRVKAVESFNQTDESADLAEANKRVKNILAKSDVDLTQVKIDPSLFEATETELSKTIEAAEVFVAESVAKNDYSAALGKLAGLKDVVNQFFDNVMINVDDQKVKENRLALINQLRNLFLKIADISLLQK